MAKLTGMQKAAVLMVTLGDETAANIFKYLEEDEIQTISREIAITKHVQPEVAEEVMEEFHTMTQARSYISQGGIEYAKKLLIKSVGPEVARKIINNKFIDGQLDDCDLSLRDLNKISESFTKILTGLFHSRIEYPAVSSAST